MAHNKAIPLLKSKKGVFVVDDTLGVSLLLATYFQKHHESVLILASNLYNAQRIANQIASLLSNEEVVLFPSDELLHANNLASSKELSSERVYALNKILDGAKKIVVAHPSSAFRYLPSPQLFKEHTISLKVGAKVNIENLVNKLLKSGYYRVNKIGRSLEFAKRGDIIDIYSINYDDPIRLSFFDDELESISFFSLATQESFKKINQVVIVPSSDMLFTKDEETNIQNKIIYQASEDKSYIGEEKYLLLRDKIASDIDRFIAHDYSESLYKYYGYLQSEHYSLFDYFKAELIFVSNIDQLRASYELLSKEAQRYLDEMLLAGNSISHLSLFQDIDRILKKQTNIIYGQNYRTSPSDIEFNARHIIIDNNKNNTLIATISSYLENNKKIIIALDNKTQRETIENALDDAHLAHEEIFNLSLPEGHIGLSIYSLNEGFELGDEQIVCLTAKELLNYRSHNSFFTSRFKEATALHSYEDLKPGDYVVHEYNGIGKFIDIVTLEVDNVHRDFIYILYAGNAKLYVPLNQYCLIRKYSGREGVIPKLSSLNTKTWEKTKEKIKERIDELTERLSLLYKERAIIGGYAFPKDDEYQEKFNNEFSYKLTEDQEQAYREIRDDMEKPYPMDRLLCGDVGFGKTEVAFRAIFKCINAGKQAALLCPTTLLCRQHYELAKVRFASFGIRIAVFSRLIPLKEQRHYIDEIKNGNIHLVIGTHRLLNKEVAFNNLGLLVVDEEQRFGVEQKERIKEIKSDVDVLSLSATPIPRTLQMSLVGIRSLSLINTAPQFRTSIQTYVTPYNEAIIRELIERELSRDGQVFYVHNNVYSIYETATKLKRLVPLAKIGIVHGQMNREEIEYTMLKFYSGEINLLVATSIIENGIDVPNANMIIIENANRFGLAQLYQIKGRVGRGDRIAYAYLLYNEYKNMSEEARSRLRAIQEFAELGSGYKIAQRDLMIRGAGDLLGREQAGFIDSIGMDLYIKLLNESVNKKQKTAIFETKPNQLFNIDAYIPDEYVIKDEKVAAYQEIESATDIASVNKIKKRLRDIYGRIPIAVNNLLLKKKIDLITSNEEFKSIKEFSNRITISLSSAFTAKKGIGLKLFNVLNEYMKHLKVSYLNKELRIDVKKEGMWVNILEEVVDKIHHLYLKEKTCA